MNIIDGGRLDNTGHRGFQDSKVRKAIVFGYESYRKYYVGFKKPLILQKDEYTITSLVFGCREWGS